MSHPALCSDFDRLRAQALLDTLEAWLVLNGPPSTRINRAFIRRAVVPALKIALAKEEQT